MSSTKGQASFLLRYALQSLAVVLGLAILLRTFIISSYAVSGASMLPSILPGDFLVGTKLHLKDIGRGAVVTMHCPMARDHLCLRRVIGLPGDRIEFKGGELVLNGQVSRYVPEGVFQTEFAGGSAWAIWPDQPGHHDPALHMQTPVVVPPQNLYLLNDKRGDHDDSRLWGPVSQDFLESKVVRIWMSLDWFDGDQVRLWPKIRWPRLMRSID